jgi:hypothetical protein
MFPSDDANFLLIRVTARAARRDANQNNALKIVKQVGGRKGVWGTAGEVYEIQGTTEAWLLLNCIGFKHISKCVSGCIKNTSVVATGVLLGVHTPRLHEAGDDLPNLHIRVQSKDDVQYSIFSNQTAASKF